ncbi:Lon protease family protein [Treponema putidum]|uniref:endopeptidase La n=1 Tax=Treponema putidum TaxID=221027 RepID=A0AAE9MW95_9SPIR|nr:ATP-binding protein [Treponema putidum]UTY29070.1 ATP-binding protein [Treponema putidum]UTY33912.1 ATP-binding protein [Treponema putidum]
MTDGAAEKLDLNELEFSFPESKIRELKNNGTGSTIVGQNRALKAIELGLGIEGEGYNIFVMGAPGTGRRTVISSLLQNYKPNSTKLQDIAYAYNFGRPIEPIALFFPPGEGNLFRKKIKKAVGKIHTQTLALLKSEVFLAEQKKIVTKTDNEENLLLMEFESKMLHIGFKVLQIKDENNQSLDLIPIIKGKEISFSELQSKAARKKFSEQELAALREKYYASLDEMSELFSILRDKRIEMDEKLIKHQKDSIMPIIKEALEPLKMLVESYKTKSGNPKQIEDNKKILLFLKKAEDDLISRMNIYSSEFKSSRVKKNFFGRYLINLICENNKDKNYVINENLPSFTNLFGTIESHSDSDAPEINGHLRIREGAVHRAFGGYLIVRLHDLLEEDDSWSYLKRVLQSGKIEIQMPPSGNHTPSVFKPEALPANFKIIIIGGEYTYDILYQEDPDFYKLFKVCAEFDSVMQKNDKNIASLIHLTEHLCKEKKALNFDDSGYSRLISYASELAGSRHLLTAQFTKISDLIIEADFNAKQQKKDTICAGVLNDTIEKRRYLHALPEEKFAEMVQLGEILIDVSGTKLAKINGLAVEERGYHSFGVPVSVTAQASPGTGGIINIEREAGLSGEIYDKAHLIITSLLREKFSKDIPLSISASICFEQSYSYIDGDSASCAEFLALISAIGGFEMRQDIAVTGSLNQHGMVQPVGGITEKIEGFFNTCKILGFTGTQGVMIPVSNKNNLFLSKDVQKAVKEGKFNIWTIKTIDEGIKLLSGLQEEMYTWMISQRLEEFYKKVNEISLRKN